MDVSPFLLSDPEVAAACGNVSNYANSKQRDVKSSLLSAFKLIRVFANTFPSFPICSSKQSLFSEF